MVKNSPANAGDVGDAGSIPGRGRSPGPWRRKIFQVCLPENPTEEPGRPQSIGVTKEFGVTKHTHTQ